MRKVAQIIPYFGKWPEWIELYFYSCSRNPMIDFIFYTDCEIFKKNYSNIQFISLSFAEYCQLVSERLGIDYHISKPYKLTDLKPFIGAIHTLELREYAFWSFGDIDLCYGDLSMLINDLNLKKYDLITTHCYHIAGHLTIVRNNEYYNNLCFRIPDWKRRSNDETHYALDEGDWSNIVYSRLKWNRFLWKYIVRRLSITDFFSFMNRANKLFNRKLLFVEYFTSPVPNKDEVWHYNLPANKITDPIGRELPYIHFLFFKKTPWLNTENFWRANYYKLSTPISQYQEIDISLNGIARKQ